MNKPLVSIVAICWNRKTVVQESLAKLQSLEYPNLEIILVDNGSTDGTEDMVREFFPDVELVCTGENLGVAAYNRGFKRAQGDFIVILDDDSYPAKGAIEKMLDKFNKNPRLGVVAFDVRDAAGDTGNQDIRKSPPVNQSKSYKMSFHGAGAGVRAWLLKKVGGYPEEFFLYFNETDTSFRIYNEGYTIESFSNIVSYHKSSKVNRTSKRAPFYYTRNSFYIIWKHYPLDMMVQKTFLLLYYVCYYTIEQKTSVYMKALFDALRNYPLVLKKRKPVSRDIAKQLRIHFESPFMVYK